MTAPLDLSEYERALLDENSADSDAHFFAQKLSDARAALRMIKCSDCACLITDDTDYDRCTMCTPARRALAGPTAPVAVPATDWTKFGGDVCDIHGNRVLMDPSKARPCSCGETACAGPDDGANHQCGGLREACGVAGCSECAAPDPAQAAYAECARIARRSHGWEVAESIALEIESAAARARGER